MPIKDDKNDNNHQDEDNSSVVDPEEKSADKDTQADDVDFEKKYTETFDQLLRLKAEMEKLQNNKDNGN